MKSYFEMTPEEKAEYKRRAKEGMSKLQSEPWVTVRDFDGTVHSIPASSYEAWKKRDDELGIARGKEMKAKIEKARAEFRASRPKIEDGKTLDELVEGNRHLRIIVDRGRMQGLSDEEIWATID